MNRFSTPHGKFNYANISFEIKGHGRRTVEVRYCTYRKMSNVDVKVDEEREDASVRKFGT